MSDEKTPRSENYRRVRDEFETLEFEDKAVFLLEASMTTIARGIESFGTMVADEMDRAFRSAERAAKDASKEGEKPADEEGAPAPNVSPENGDEPPTPEGL